MLYSYRGCVFGCVSHYEASGSESFLFSCAFHSADAIMIARALGGAFYTQLPRLRPLLKPSYNKVLLVFQKSQNKHKNTKVATRKQFIMAIGFAVCGLI